MALDTILLAVGSGDRGRTDRITDAVVDVAGPTGATVVLAHVFTEAGFEDVVDQLDYDPGSDADADDVAARLGAIQDAGGTLDGAGIDYDVVGAVSEDPGDAVVGLAETVGADQVFIGGRKRSPVGKAVFGSTAQTVALNAPCPVTFVKQQ